MAMIPVSILFVWLLGLLGFTLVGGAGWLVWQWYDRSWDYRLTPDGLPVPSSAVFDPDFGWNAPSAFLVASVVLLLWALLGGWLLRTLGRRLARPSAGGATRESLESAPGGTVHRIPRPDGAEIVAEVHGPIGAPPIVLTHGWGANRSEWNDLVRRLGDRFRLITWDLPGLGQSRAPADRDFSLDRMARDLDAVLELAHGRPAVLLGHSIGGMITQVFARLDAQALGTRVAGLVLVHTTYKNPVRTTKNAPLYTALEKPVLVPLLYLTIGLWPLVWLMQIVSYLNGSAHRSSKRSGFAGTETPDQVDWATRFQLQAPPQVIARGMFGMMAFDETANLPAIPVPTLVISGDRDPVCLPEASEHIDRALPDSRLAPLAPAKHMGLIEHAGRFAEMVAEFTARTAGAPRDLDGHPREAVHRDS